MPKENEELEEGLENCGSSCCHQPKVGYVKAEALHQTDKSLHNKYVCMYRDEEETEYGRSCSLFYWAQSRGERMNASWALQGIREKASMAVLFL